MRIFGMSLLTLAAVLAVGYALAMVFPGIGSSVKGLFNRS